MAETIIKIEGTQELLRNLNKWEDKISDDTGDIIQVGAFEITKEARRAAPKDTGLLKARIKKKKLGKFSAEVLAETHYASYVEFGTVKMRAQPYMRPAVEMVAPKIVKEIKRIVPK